MRQTRADFWPMRANFVVVEFPEEDKRRETINESGMPGFLSCALSCFISVVARWKNRRRAFRKASHTAAHG
jgi:hypothetical protein